MRSMVDPWNLSNVNSCWVQALQASKRSSEQKEDAAAAECGSIGRENVVALFGWKIWIWLIISHDTKNKVKIYEGTIITQNKVKYDCTIAALPF